MTKYTKIYNHILDNYVLKRKIDDKIPNEVDIAKEFGISRMTVNKAISTLVDEGYLKRVRGKGTYIISKTSNNSKDMGVLYSYTEDMKKRGVTPTTKILNYEYVDNPNDELCLRMNLDEKAHLHKIVRIRYIEEKPISIDYSYISAKYVSKFQIAKSNESMIDYYEKELGINIGYEDQDISAAVADKSLSKSLSINIGDPLLKINSTLSTTSDEIFEYSIVYYVTGAYKLKQRAYRPSLKKID